jgi:formate/nitrite transporter FocA (FNT family)
MVMLVRYLKEVISIKKVSASFGATVVKGIFANWLVCVATWQANAAQDLTGKAVAIW